MKEKIKTEQSIQLWNNIKRCNMYIIGIQEGEEKQKKAEEMFERIMAEIFFQN